ncbi:phage major capsid protein [Arthrobacter sp. ISL-69]|uniref:phage major capsid protein n=1 Tax=Arthrobacter sp. ISL-69 TaxID=2819113 RepID=UPI001BE8A87D|nr:phage major capsid protein [Arthrobacter sp. ISL-69]MBT2535883.1 phage major capsid protein [Arthrobacter sp. ISL-69]
MTFNSSRSEMWRAKAAAEAQAARGIAEKAAAAGRDLTANEKTAYDAHMTAARGALDSLKSAKADESVLEHAKTLAAEVGEPAAVGGFDGRRKGAGSRWSKAAAARVAGALISEAGGQKALVTGTIGVPSPLETDVVALSTTPRSLLELIPVKPMGGGFGVGNSFSFLRQTVRTNNAAPVADGALKPTSVFSIAEIDDRVRVIAHLSEAVPERYFADHAALEEFLRSEMEAGILDALQDQVVNGDGEDENLTGILATSGIISQAFVTDRLTSIRKGLTQLQATGVTPNALVLNPADLEALDLLRADGATGAFLLGDPSAESATNIWSVPRIPSNAVAAGTALLADWNQAEIVVREDATLSLDRSGENFTKNLVTMRVEGRFGLAVKRPASFAVVDLAA